MSELLRAIKQLHSLAAGGFPRNPTVLPETERSFRLFDEAAGEPEPVEDLVPFLERSSARGVAALGRTELNRVLRGAWCDSRFDEFGMHALARADGEARRSSDQAMIDGYLGYFPRNRAVMGALSQATRRAAERHQWAWLKRSVT